MKKITKTEKFQARFDEQTKFALELIAHQKGQKQVTIVEDAVMAAARELCEKQFREDFSNIYDAHPGVRTLNLLAHPAYKLTNNIAELKAFILAHREFFYTDDKATIPNVALTIALWDKLEHYLQTWNEKRHENYWVAAELMEAALKKAKIKPPKYGQSK